MDTHTQAIRRPTLRVLLFYITAALALLSVAYYTDAPDQVYRMARRSTPPPPPNDDLDYENNPLSPFISGSTLEALASDPRLSSTYTSALTLASTSLSDLSKSFPDVPLFSRASALLSSHISTLNTPSSARNSNSNSDTDVQHNDNTKRDILSDFLTPITDLFSNPTTSLIPPAFFLGIGLGEGASSALSLATPARAGEVADAAITANGLSASGLNPVIQGAARGAASALVGSVDLEGLMEFDGTMLPKMVLRLAEGVGNGTAAGLQLSERARGLSAQTEMGEGDDVLEVAAGTLGFGLSRSLAGNVELDAGGFDVTALLGETSLGEVALTVGEGLGNGTISGLGATERPPPEGSGDEVLDVAGNFAYGLSRSLASGIDLDLEEDLDLGGGEGALMIMLPEAAMGLGMGLSEGVGMGLGVVDMGVIPLEVMPDGALDVAGATRNFARGLSAGLVGNGTVGKIVSSFASETGEDGEGGLGDVNIARVAQGLARGLVQGVGEGIDAVGGVEAVVGGTARLPDPVDMTGAMDLSIEFDDGVRGAAAGFGLGVGGQGVFVVTRIMEGMRERAELQETGIEERGLVRRQEANDGGEVEDGEGNTAEVDFLDGSLSLNVSSILTTEAIESVAQGAVDGLTCQGVGGVFNVLAGLGRSGVLVSTPADGEGEDTTVKLFKQLIPEGTIEIASGGNRFEVDLRNGLESGDFRGSVRVNGNGMGKLIGFLVVHVLVAISTFLILLPSIIGLESTKFLLIRIGKPHILPTVQRWVTSSWFFGMVPGCIVVLVFGALAMGEAKHFNTVHGVLGLLTILLAVGGVGVQWVLREKRSGSGQVSSSDRSLWGHREKGNGSDSHDSSHHVNEKANNLKHNPKFIIASKVLGFLLLILSVAAALTGFIDMGKISLCLSQLVPFELGILVGFFLAGVWSVGFVLGLGGLWVAFSQAGTRGGDGAGKRVEQA